MRESIFDKTGMRAMLGSGLMWAWFDALYMSSFFPAWGSGLMSEGAALVVFVWTLPILLLFLACPRVARLCTGSRGWLLGAGVSGAVGALLMMVADALSLVALLVPGTLLSGYCMTVLTLAWGGLYCQGGAMTATPYVAGAFACAIVFDLPLFFMLPGAAGVFSSAFPVVSAVVLGAIAPEARDYAAACDPGAARLAAGKGSPLRRSTGIPFAILAGYLLVMFGFGFLQHLISFSPAFGGGESGGIQVQVARGLASVLMLLAISRNLAYSKAIYRVGLPVMIAGCMLLPFALAGSTLVVPATLIIAGYTAFDLFAWVVFCSIARTQSTDPMRTVVVMRVVCALGHVMGGALGIAMCGYEASPAPFMAQTTNFVGYLIVIAVVLLLSSEEVFVLSNGDLDCREALRDAQGPAPDVSRPGEGGQDWLEARFDELGLTARERDVARELTRGRTQKWIAGSFCISENTVGTHLRKIYQKAGVHNRQQFLDVLAAKTPASHDLREN